MMLRRALIAAIVLILAAAPVAAQKTPPSLVDAYEALADTILSVRAAEANFVRALLDGHRHAAEILMKRGDYEAAAAEIALFANEGDNAVGGVRKRLLEGGHHFNAEGEEKGLYEPGYVIVTREAKQKILEASAALRKAGSDDERTKVWEHFSAIADKLLKKM
jgi:hypothetical protein